MHGKKEFEVFEWASGQRGNANLSKRLGAVFWTI